MFEQKSETRITIHAEPILKKWLPIAAIITGVLIIFSSDHHLAHILVIATWCGTHLFPTKWNNFLSDPKNHTEIELSKVFISTAIVTGFSLFVDQDSPIWLLHLVSLFRVALEIRQTKYKYTAVSLLAVFASLPLHFTELPNWLCNLPFFLIFVVFIPLDGIVSFLYQNIAELKAYDQKLEGEIEKVTDELEARKVANINSARMASLGEMSGGIAHEINNPLGIILGYIGRIEKTHSNGTLTDEKLKHYCTRISVTIMRMKAIVEGLRKFSRDDSNADFSERSVGELVNDAIGMSVEQHKSAGIITLTNAEKFMDLLIECRGVQLGQVIINIINNARHAVSLVKEKEISTVIEDLGNRVKISIIDSGPGLNSETEKKMFEPFFTTKDIGEGTGLGLSISKGIVEDHEGTLEYKRLGNKTHFIITIPKKQTAPKEESLKKVANF